MKGSLPVAFVAAIATAASAHADIIPNTGTGGGSTDLSWSVSYALTAGGGALRALTSLANAPLVTSIPSVWQPNDPPNNNWIGVNSTGTFVGGTEFLSPTQLLGAGNEDKSGFC